jgi:uncharacterized protein YdhG (YjbR/CyaY superfamily)
MNGQMAEQSAASVDEYIAGFPPETRRVLEDLRALVRESVPGVTERMSYAIPTFELHGRYVVYFGGWKRHIGFYPVTARLAGALGEEIEPYRTGKGSLRFPLSKPLPRELIRRVVELRRDEVLREADREKGAS